MSEENGAVQAGAEVEQPLPDSLKNLTGWRVERWYEIYCEGERAGGHGIYRDRNLAIVIGRRIFPGLPDGNVRPRFVLTRGDTIGYLVDPQAVNCGGEDEAMADACTRVLAKLSREELALIDPVLVAKLGCARKENAGEIPIVNPHYIPF